MNTYSPSYYATDSEWLEWIAAEYEAEQAAWDAYVLAMNGNDALTHYASTAGYLARWIEDTTEKAVMQAEQDAVGDVRES